MPLTTDAVGMDWIVRMKVWIYLAQYKQTIKNTRKGLISYVSFWKKVVGRCSSSALCDFEDFVFNMHCICVAMFYCVYRKFMFTIIFTSKG